MPLLSLASPGGKVNSNEGLFVPCKLAMRIPKPKQTGCAVTDGQNVAQWRACQHLLSYLLDGHMDKAQTLLSNALQEKKEGSESDWWDDSYHKFGKLPRYWLGNLLTKFSSFTESDIVKVEKHDPEGVRHLFEYFLAIDSNSPMPQLMLNKRICAEACIARARIVKRHEGFKALAFNPGDGSLDWSQKWAYSLEFDKDGWLCKCKHTGTNDSVNVSGKNKWNREEWSLNYPMHDMQAHLASDDMRKYLHTFFKNTGPHTWKLPAKGKSKEGPMWELARKAAEKMQKLDDSVAETEVASSAALKEVAEERRRAKIKEAQAKRKADTPENDAKSKKAKTLKL